VTVTNENPTNGVWNIGADTSNDQATRSGSIWSFYSHEGERPSEAFTGDDNSGTNESEILTIFIANENRDIGAQQLATVLPSGYFPAKKQPGSFYTSSLHDD